MKNLFTELRASLFAAAVLCFMGTLLPVSAQTLPPQQDPLKKILAAGQATGQNGACSPSGESLCEEAAPKIIANALGPSPLYENLRRLTDEIGGRQTGSPAMARAIAWAVEAFHAAGLENVKTETYTIPVNWSEGATRLEILGARSSPVRLVSIGWGPATPAGGITANVVDVGDGTAADFARVGGAARGAIVLVHSALLQTLEGLFAEYMEAPGIIDRSVAAGALAILWTSSREHGLLYRHTNSTEGQLDRLPQAIVAREDAEQLARFLAAGQAMHVRLDIPNHIGGPVEQQNVIAEIRGREKPDEYVVVTAHLDSWELGTGALDNGCNAALVIEAARDIAATGLKPRRSIRFLLVSGEEQGLLGSWAYVRAHRGEMDRVAGVVVIDEGVGRITGYSLGGRTDTEAALRSILKPVESWGVTQHTPDAMWGTDHFDFMLEGVPTLVANQEAANYMVNYHAASDTLDKVDIREVKINAAIIGITTFGIAEQVARFGPRQTRGEIEAMLKQTGLAQQMQQIGIWSLWQSGARGRQP
jgi:carboxypeptidase Q